MVMITPAHAVPLQESLDVQLRVGGAESNVATHAARLGVSAAWVGAVGDDALGIRVRNDIASHGVSVDWVIGNPDARTGVYFKDPGRGVLYYRNDSAAARMTSSDVANVPFEDADIVHLSGITPALSPSCSSLIGNVFDRVAAASTMLSFDINHRPALWDDGAAAAALLALARRADLVFVGLDEAHELWQTADEDAVRRLLPEPRLLVVKDSDRGATEFHRVAGADERTFVPAIPTEVVEAIGAGDAFAAGYLVALQRHADAVDRLAAGHARASLVLQSTSDFVPDDVAERSDDDITVDQTTEQRKASPC